MTISREHLRVLEMAFETFARQWGTQLTTRLRTLVQVAFEGVRQQTYDEYVRPLGTPSAMVLFTADGTRAATGVAHFAVGTTMTWIDLMLGGGSSSMAQPERELTEIEQSLVSELMERSLADLSYAFSSVVSLAPAITAIQYNPQFVQAAAASDPVIVATFTVRLPGREDTASLMLPAGLLLSHLSDPGEADQRSLDELAERAATREVMERSLTTVPLDVSVRFASRNVSPFEIGDLKVGDVVRLPHPASRPLEVVAADTVFARAVAGTSGSRLACLVVSEEETR